MRKTALIAVALAAGIVFAADVSAQSKYRVENGVITTPRGASGPYSATIWEHRIGDSVISQSGTVTGPDGMSGSFSATTWEHRIGDKMVLRSGTVTGPDGVSRQFSETTFDFGVGGSLSRHTTGRAYGVDGTRSYRSNSTGFNTGGFRSTYTTGTVTDLDGEQSPYRLNKYSFDQPEVVGKRSKGLSDSLLLDRKRSAPKRYRDQIRQR